LVAADAVETAEQVVAEGAAGPSRCGSRPA